MNRFSLLLFLLPLQVFSQPAALKDQDVPAALISSTNLYGPDNFRSHIQSGGDMIMEYGIRNLLVQELRYPDEHITVEVYEMNDPVSAYGLYSVSILGCKAQSLSTSFDCYNGTDYYACSGRFYYRLVSESPRAADRSLFSNLAVQLIKNNPDTSFLLPQVFRSDLVKRSGKYPFCMKGVLGVQHSPFPWQDLFKMVRATMFAIILPFDRDVYFAEIMFDSPGDLNTFLKRAGMMNGFNPLPNITTPEGQYREYRPLSDKHIYFLECQLPFPISSIAP